MTQKKKKNETQFRNPEDQNINDLRRGVQDEDKLRNTLYLVQKVHNTANKDGVIKEDTKAVLAQAVHTLRHALNLEGTVNLQPGTAMDLLTRGYIEEVPHSTRGEVLFSTVLLFRPSKEILKALKDGD